MQVRGHFELPTGEKIEKPLLFGKWDEAMYADMPDGSQTLLWQKSEPPPDPTRCIEHTTNYWATHTRVYAHLSRISCRALLCLSIMTCPAGTI